MDPLSYDGGFGIVLDVQSDVDADASMLGIGEDIGGATSAVTITGSASDEAAGVYIELVPAATSEAEP